MNSSIATSTEQRIRKLTPRLITVAAVLVLSTALAIVSSYEVFKLVLLLLSGLAIVQFLARDLVFGLIVLIPISVFLSFDIDTGTNTPIGLNLVLIAALACIWILQRPNRRRTLALPQSSTVTPLLALCALAALAFVIGQLPWFAFSNNAPLRAQAGGLATFVVSALIFLLAATQVRSLVALQRLTWVFLLVGAAVTLGRLLPGSFDVLSEATNRGATGSLFWTWLVAMALSQATTNTGLRRSVRIGMLGLALSVFYLNLIHAGSWVSGWIPPAVAALVILWIGLPRTAFVASMAGVAAAFVGTQRFAGLSMLGDNQYSLATRLEAWRIVAEIVKANPILGLGPANYYWYAPLFPIRGYSVRFNSHNNYVDLVAQTGILGLIMFLWFGLSLARVGWGLLNEVPAGFPRAYVVGALGGLAGTLVAGMLGDWIIPFVYNVGLNGLRASLIGWLFLGGLVALEQMTKSNNFEPLEAGN